MAEKNVQAYIGLGSNLDTPREQLARAITALQDTANMTVLKISSIYQSAPIGPDGQPDYLNAVVLVQTDLEPQALLDRLQQVEQAQGRVRTQKWGARTLDLDILLYNNKSLQTPRLTIPHPQMTQRSFVLMPLREIASDDLLIPGYGSLANALLACPGHPVFKLNDVNG